MFKVGKQVIPLFAACGEMHEILDEQGNRFAIVNGLRSKAEAVCEQMNKQFPQQFPGEARWSGRPQISRYLPSCLQGEGKTSSISVERALKNIKNVLIEDTDGNWQAALDDCDTMLDSFRRN